MTDKLTDSEIVKALECAIRNDCDCNCVFLLPNKVQDVLDLINRQKAEVSELQHRNSELEIELKSMRGAANSYKAEVERLKDTLNATIAGQETFQRYIATAKAEAYKEFAERLKERAIQTSFDPIYGSIMTVDVDDVDNLLKELVGEDK